MVTLYADDSTSACLTAVMPWLLTYLGLCILAYIANSHFHCCFWHSAPQHLYVGTFCEHTWYSTLTSLSMVDTQPKIQSLCFVNYASWATKLPQVVQMRCSVIVQLYGVSSIEGSKEVKQESRPSVGTWPGRWTDNRSNGKLRKLGKETSSNDHQQLACILSFKPHHQCWQCCRWGFSGEL
jgi:hypothetical protein